MPRDLDGRVVLLTGATDGVGRAAATAFAARGATLTIVGRDAEKTARTVAELRATTGNGAVDAVVADLSTLAGMRAVTAAVRARWQRLDLLVNNAGAIFLGPGRTVDGLDPTFALNHLAYFVLATELLDLLRDTAGARVVNTASTAYRFGRNDFAAMPTRERGAGFVAGFRVYCDTKLANIAFTRELARRLAPFGVPATCHHPGFTRSRLFAGAGGAWRPLFGNPLTHRVGGPPERTIDTLLWLATDPAAAGFSGRYLYRRRPVPVRLRARDERHDAALWELSARIATSPAGSAAPPAPAGDRSPRPAGPAS